MNLTDYSTLYTDLSLWMDRYIKEFERQYPGCIDRFDLKKTHSLLVAREIADLATAVGLEAGDRVLSQITGLLHDVGRFQQAACYHTFNDDVSVDHGDFGVKIIGESGLLVSLSPEDRNAVETAIRYHNKPELPTLEDPRCRLLAQLLRDADKVDIFRVIHGNLQIQNPGDTTLPLGKDISAEVMDAITQNRIVYHRHIKNRIDKVFFRISWLFDINFPQTLKLIRERGYYQILRARVPETEAIVRALASVDRYCDSRLSIID